jgi:hypothetical protein
MAANGWTSGSAASGQEKRPVRLRIWIPITPERAEWPRSDSTVPANVPAGNAYTIATPQFRKIGAADGSRSMGDDDPSPLIAAAGTEFRIQLCVPEIVILRPVTRKPIASQASAGRRI